ncbi:hypothetical protein H4J58_13165 [Colwellia sp. MB3u-70]|uniref:ATP-dependent DNA ligase n=1 Tax=unclassified Colwellia TaxID=196834 RepID=UPI0015F41B3F|nr:MULTISPECIES: hypothetical protein [unclassified Colwellia]MBA6292853.1 hypothetical protein [Colwellia sp. MB3u-8]MBA6308063.1 hypothetical protein [Colwellia sp. MB3u-70]
MKVIFEQTIYRINANKSVGSWQIQVTENDAESAVVSANIITTQIKVLGGKGVESVTTIDKGKNIGKANETSVTEQAILNAQATADKKIKKGYLTDIPTGEEQVTNSLGFLKPMLAQTLDKVKNWQFPLLCSPKLDGHRLLATVKDKQAVLYSRQGKTVELPHIKNELQKLFDNNIWNGATLDGEIYLHGESLQTISSLVKKQQPQTEQLKYYLYDTIETNQPYPQRLNYLNNLLNANNESISIVDTKELTTNVELDLFHSENLASGFEGTMLRWSDTGYEDGKRSKSLIKKKDFQDAEFTVIDIAQGKTVTRNGNTYELPIYVCETLQGEKFNCVASGTLQEKHQAWLEKDHAIGKQLTVKFFNYTDNNIPFLPVAIGLRNDI